MLRFAGGVAAVVLVAPVLAACSSAPATPTAAPPTPVPHPTDVLPTVAPPTAVPTAAPTAAATAAATAAPTAVPTVAATPTAATNPAALPAAELTWLQVDYVPFVDISKKIIADFKPLQPNITVNLTTLPGDSYATKEKLQATAGTPYDVSFVCCGDVATYGELGLLLNLDPYITSSKLDRGIYFAGSFWEGLFDAETKYLGSGNVLALPVNYVMDYHVYNKTMLKKAGVDEPSWDWTWADMQAMAVKLTLDKNGKKPTDAGFDPANIVQYGYSDQYWNFYDYFIAAGGRWVTPDNKVVINSPANLTATTYLVDLIHKYHVMPGKKAGPDIPLFPTGKSIATVKTGFWDWTPYVTDIKDFEWDVVPVPIGPTGQRIAYGGSNQFASWKGLKSPDAAWALLSWIASPEMTLKYWSTKGVPSVKAAALSPDFQKIAQLTPKMAKLAGESGAYIQSNDPTIRKGEWFAALSAELDPVWEGKVAPADGLKSAQAKVEAIMNRH
jgi:multiple sugar transport system substrate-binding protein